MLNKKKLQNLKLIIPDLDGSLLNNDSRLDEKTKKIIKALHSMGVLFSFASGRLHSALIDYAEELKIVAPLISLDGSLIKSHPGGEVIYQSFVPGRYVEKALNYADKFLINVALCHAEAVYYTEDNSVIPVLMDKFGAKFQQISSYKGLCGKTLEIALAGDFKNNIKYVKKKMSFPYTYGLNITFIKSMKNPGIYYLELRRKGANKGKALLRLLKHLKIKPAETAVIGDWYNDISFFHPSVIKVAMANAIPELKKMADFITQKDNDHEGAAEFLEMVYKAKKSI
jgi:Cof subfamily protein (haloacid dehalogenase superfamily)